MSRRLGRTRVCIRLCIERLPANFADQHDTLLSLLLLLASSLQFEVGIC